MEKIVFLKFTSLMLVFLIHGKATDASEYDNSLLYGIDDFLHNNVDTLNSISEYIVDTQAKQDFKNLIKFSANNETEGDERCQTCKLFFTAMKSLSATRPWEDVREIGILLCERVMGGNDSDTNTDVLCPGAIDNQGPHVYEISKPIHRKSVDEICNTLNMCLTRDRSRYHSNYRSKRTVLNKLDSTDGSLFPIPSLFQAVDSVKHSLQQRKMNALKIVQYTDMHIDPRYAEGSSTDCGLYVCCLDKYGTGDAGAYGDYNCNIPPRTADLFLEKAKDFQPDFILYSGDTPPHTYWEETYNSQLNCTGEITDAFRRLLPEYTVYPNIGNHEMYPTNLYSMKYLNNYTEPMTKEFTNLWMDLANFTDESIESFQNGGYYTQVIAPGLRLVSFNTLYWYTMNWYNVLHIEEQNSEIDTMIQFMKDSFELAKNNGEKVLVMGHHPPAGLEIIIKYTRMFEDLLNTYSDLIVLHVAGHTHYDEFKLHVTPDGEALGLTLVCPSMTTKTNKNPSMRVLYLDENTYELLDYEQYGFDIEDARKKAHAVPVIELWYSAMEAYGLPNMSPDSWNDLANRMVTDRDLFDVFHNNYITGYKYTECDSLCQHNVICSVRFYSYDDHAECREQAIPEVTTPASGTRINKIADIIWLLLCCSFIFIHNL